MTALRDGLAPLAEAARNAPRGLPWSQAHIAYFIHFHPDVGAALVAVADAAARNQEVVATEVPPGEDPTGVVLDRDRSLTAALDALAAALGVSQ